MNILEPQSENSNYSLNTLSSHTKSKIRNDCFCNLTEITLSSQFAKLKGSKGDKGNTGEPGLPGLPGKGEKGETGPKGEKV
jgi:hypothetical protein